VLLRTGRTRRGAPGGPCGPPQSTTLTVKKARMETDPKFFDRADAHINLSNEQMDEISRGKVSASMMYATARFNAWVSACGFESSSDMAKAKAETIEYFAVEYRKMLDENLDDYIRNFEKYMKAKKASGGT
jgi:hypothetical protein